MTPINLLIVLALTWLSVTIIWWLFAPKEDRRPLVTVLLLIVYTVWIIGVPIIVARQ